MRTVRGLGSGRAFQHFAQISSDFVEMRNLIRMATCTVPHRRRLRHDPGKALAFPCSRHPPRRAGASSVPRLNQISDGSQQKNDSPILTTRTQDEIRTNNDNTTHQTNIRQSIIGHWAPVFLAVSTLTLGAREALVLASGTTDKGSDMETTGRWPQSSPLTPGLELQFLPCCAWIPASIS